MPLRGVGETSSALSACQAKRKSQIFSESFLFFLFEIDTLRSLHHHEMHLLTSYHKQPRCVKRQEGGWGCFWAMVLCNQGVHSNGQLTLWQQW